MLAPVITYSYHSQLFISRNSDMYEELRRKIQQEKNNLQSQMQQINHLKNTPKVYTVYQKPSAQGGTTSRNKNEVIDPTVQKQQNNTSTHQQQPPITNKTTPPPQPLPNHQQTSQSQTSPSTDLQVIDKLKATIEQKDRQISELTKKYEYLRRSSEQQYGKLSSEEKRLKDLVKEMNKKQQEQDDKITKLEEENYEVLVKYEQMQNAIDKKQAENSKLTQQYEELTSFLKQVVTQLKGKSQQLENKCDQLNLQTNLLGKQSSDSENQAQQSVVKQFNCIRDYLQRMTSCSKVIHEQLLSSRQKNAKWSEDSTEGRRAVDNKNEQIRKLQEYINELTGQKNNLAKELQREKAITEQLKVAQKSGKEELAKTIKNQEEKIYKLEQKLQNYQKEAEKHQSQLNQLKQTIEKGKKQLEDEQTRSVKRQQQLDEQNRELRQKVDESLVDLKIKEHEINTLQQQKQQLSKKIQIQQSKISAPPSQESQNNQKEESSPEGLQDQTPLNEALEKISALTQQNQKIKMTLQELLKQLQTAKQEKSQLLSQKQQIQRQHNSLRQQLQLLKSTNNETDELSQLRQKLTESNNECEQLRDENEELLEKIEEAEKLKTSLKDDLFRFYMMSKEFDQMKVQFENLRNENKKLKGKQPHNKQGTQQPKSEQKHDKILQQKDELSRQNQKLKSDNANLKQQLTHAHTTSINTVERQKQSDTLKEQNKKMTDKLQQMQNNMEILQQQLRNYSEAQLKVTEIERQYETLKVQNNQLTEKVKQLQHKIQQLRQQLSDYEEAQSKVTQLTHKSSQLQEQNIKLSNQMKQIQNNFKRLKYESESQQKKPELSQEQLTLKEENTKLTNQIKQMEDNVVQLREQLKDFAQTQLRIIQKDKESATLKLDNQKLTNQVKQFEQNMIQLKKQLKDYADAQAQVVQNIGLLTSLQEENGQLKKQIIQLKEQLKQYQKVKRESTVLESNCNELKEQKLTLKEQIGTLNTQIKQFKQNISQLQKVIIESVANETRYFNIAGQSKKKDQELQVKNNQIKKLNEEVSLLKQKGRQASNGYIKKIEAELEEVKKQLVNKENELKDVQLYTQSVKEENRTLQKNIDYLNEKAEKINKLKKTSSFLEAKNNELEQQLEQKDKQLETKHSQLQIIDQQLLALKKQNSILKQNVETLQVKVKSKSLSDCGHITHENPKKTNHEQKGNKLAGILGRIRINCLKNNCDSVGIINIEFEKILTDAHIITSPTDLQKFNKNKEEQDEVDSFELEGQSSNNIYSPNSPSQPDPDSKEINEMIKKGSITESLVANKTVPEPEKAKDKIESRIKSSQRLKKDQNKDNQTPDKKLQSACSLQNNPDDSFEPMPYPLLMEKYQNLQSDYDKMQNYVNKVQENIKLKKTMEQVDQYAHYTVIDKIAERFSQLLRGSDRKDKKRQSSDFTQQLGKIVEDLKNYIHFVQSLTKLDSINKEGKYIPIRVDRHTVKKEKASRKVLSEGDIHEDYQFEGIDGRTNSDHEEQYRKATELKNQRSEKAKQKLKKYQQKQEEDDKLHQYFDRKKQGYSQISSVKNRSLFSRDSFFNSRSEFGQLGNYYRMKLNEFTEQNKQEDTERLSQMSLNQIKIKYKKVKQSNKLLEATKEMLEKTCTEFEHQQKQYQRKIAKMTRQFNESFAMLCKLSGGQLKLQKSTSGQASKNECEAQTNTQKQITTSEAKEETGCRQQEANAKKVEQLMAVNQQLREGLKQVEERHQQILSRMRQKIIQPLMEVLKKNNFDFIAFMKKMKQEVPSEIIRRAVSSDSELNKKSFKRKGSDTYAQVDAIKEVDESNLNYSQVLNIVGNELHIETDEFKDGITPAKLQELLQDRIKEMKHNISLDFLGAINDNLIKFNALESAQDRRNKMEEHKQELLKYFGNHEKINQVVLSVKDLISVLRRDNSNCVSHLSLNSKEDVKINYDDDDFDEPVFKKKIEDLKDQKDELEQMNRQLNNEVEQLRTALYRREACFSELKEEQTKLQDIDSNQELLKIRDIQIQGLQRQRAILEAELSRVKEKHSNSKKKAKVYYINH